MNSGDINLDPNGLYILLSDIGAEFRFHWGLYLAKESAYGTIFHVINGPHTGNKWEYQTKSSNRIPYSLNLLLAIKIAVIDPVLHDALAERLAQVPVRDSGRYGPVSCRVWLKEALEELDNEGYIALKAPVSQIEEDAINDAEDNRARRRRTVIKSPLSRA
ncbi:hypothetical protein Plec18167_006263 [Paecilomyces lecythidis]|uniref:Uncharacterized protein n=1 Tax=Paecilomyces lecythidis TaxID=3004212 RepID=A0ABR3XCQ9_9EURO